MFIWPHWFLVVKHRNFGLLEACSLFSCSMRNLFELLHVGSSFLSIGEPGAPCIGRTVLAAAPGEVPELICSS